MSEADEQKERDRMQMEKHGIESDQLAGECKVARSPLATSSTDWREKHNKSDLSTLSLHNDHCIYAW